MWRKSVMNAYSGERDFKFGISKAEISGREHWLAIFQSTPQRPGVFLRHTQRSRDLHFIYVSEASIMLLM